MAKHGKRRRYNLRKVRVSSILSVGALASLDLTEGNLHTVPTDPLRIVSVRFSYSLTDLAAVIDDGAEFGLAHGDYSAAEIEECLEAQSGINRNDKIANERANRLVRSIGRFTGSPGADGSKDVNDGKPIHTKLNWYIGIGQALAVWIRNGSDTVWTSGTNIVTLGEMWVKDSV